MALQTRPAKRIIVSLAYVIIIFITKSLVYVAFAGRHNIKEKRYTSHKAVFEFESHEQIVVMRYKTAYQQLNNISLKCFSVVEAGQSKRRIRKNKV